MNKWLASIRAFIASRRAFFTSRRTFGIVAIVLVLATAGTAIEFATQAGVAQSHRVPNHDSETDHEQLNAAPLSSTGSCGVERWSVKTGTDADAGLINLNSTTATTIASLIALPAPATLPSNNRIQPTETTVFQLQDTLTEYKLETDSDYHLVLADASGNTMIVEIPDPACVGSTSPLLPGIQTARSEFDAHYTPTGSFQTANVPVTVRGVGFFDYLHGQTGVAPNGIELHAVLDVQFGSGSPTPTPVPPTPTPAPTGSLTNGGFETGTFSGWTTSGAATSISTTSHTGTYSGEAGSSSATNGDSSIAQTFTAPTGASSLSFWYKVVCPDTVTYDWATATLKDNTSSTTTTPLAKTCSNTGAWSQVTASVTAGHSYTLTLTSHDDNYSSDPTYTLFDDVAIATSGSPTPTPIPPTPTPVPPTPTPAPTGGITNGGFETGTFSGWTTSGAATSISTTAHSGTYSAMAGSTSATNGDSSISQTFTAPSGSPTLSFWYNVVCPDTVTYDWATATLKDNTINTTTTVLADTCSNTGTWSQVTKSLYPGDSYTLTLTSHDDNYSADPTYTLYDDVTVG